MYRKEIKPRVYAKRYLQTLGCWASRRAALGLVANAGMYLFYFTWFLPSSKISFIRLYAMSSRKGELMLVIKQRMWRGTPYLNWSIARSNRSWPGEKKETFRRKSLRLEKGNDFNMDRNQEWKLFMLTSVHKFFIYSRSCSKVVTF